MLAALAARWGSSYRTVMLHPLSTSIGEHCSLSRMTVAYRHGKSKSTDLFCAKMGRWPSGATRASASRRRSSSSAGAIWWNTARAGLSLRAIARDLGMVSSAVYRYVSSRDELLTLLLVDAYSDLADAVDRAREAVPDVWSDDVIAIAHAARSWAIAHPASWALLYGSPVPGYHAPAERTVGPGTRVVGALFDAVAAGIATGDIMLTNYPAPQPISSDFERLRQEFGFPGDDPVIAKCFAIWAGVVGAISLEVFGQYGTDTLSDPQCGVRHPGSAAGRCADPARRRSAAIPGFVAELERVQSPPRCRMHLRVATSFPAVSAEQALGYPARR